MRGAESAVWLTLHSCFYYLEREIWINVHFAVESGKIQIC